MKIALLGFGNMGQEIAALVQKDPRFEVISVSFENNNPVMDSAGVSKADVAIDFTSPQIVLENIKAVAKLGTALVVGTTGWYDRISEVEGIVRDAKIGLVYGQNFSIGANLFFRIADYAGGLFNRYEQYDVYGFEIHHSGKKDSPSGTAKKTAEILLKNISRKKSVLYEKAQAQIKPEQLHFASIRAGSNPGRHSVVFDSAADEIAITHQAFGRQAFAHGALVAAEFIKNKKGIFTFDQVLDSL
jgi:4-hydroxy-tetrahydrodipicolinate reductase